MHTVYLQDQEIGVGKIIGIGRNYAAHARELGNPVPDEAILFMKPATSIVKNGGFVVIPEYSDNCHHEIELAVLIGQKGKNILGTHAMDHIAGYAVALDLTLRDVQSRQKEKGLPWEIAKAFDTACPLSDFILKETVPDVQDLDLRLLINGHLRQAGRTSDMLFTVKQLVEVVSSYFTLDRGDIILTGTPEGVGPIRSGDQLDASISQIGTLQVSVA